MPHHQLDVAPSSQLGDTPHERSQVGGWRRTVQLQLPRAEVQAARAAENDY